MPVRQPQFLLVAAVALAGMTWASGCGDGATEPTPPPPDPPRPTTVTVTPATAQLAALSATVRLAARVLDQNGQAMSGTPVSWTSSDASVAAVDASGLVTTAGNGTATITATAGSASGSATVTVAQEVRAVAVSPPTGTLLEGDTLRLSAEAVDANGHAVAGAEFAWTSGDTLVARVDASGLVTGVAAGGVEVEAISSSVAGRSEITVVEPMPTMVAVTPDTVALTALGQTAQFAAEVRDQIGRAMSGEPVVWASGDTLVATVDSAGLVTATGGGATTVTAGAGEATGEATVTVMQSASSVAVSPAADTIAPGDTLRLVAEAFDENGHAVEGAVFTWSSSDASVAMVDASGLVRGIAEGRAMIAAASGQASGTAGITVENPDRQALVALYNATDGPNWQRSDNWLTDAPLAEWEGVSVAYDGRVRSLILSENGLSGPIPPAVANLSRLDNLFLFFNALTGGIPPELGDLSALRALELGKNQLTGPIPPELGNLQDLQRLNLAGNSLSGPIPPELGQLVALEWLELSYNDLSGPLPPELGNLTLLQLLNLDGNSLSGPIPPELANLQRLENLWVSGNDFCAPADPGLRTWLVEIMKVSLLPCPDPDSRLLPRALLREDSNGLWLSLPEDLVDPLDVTVSDPAVVDARATELGWLELSPRASGSAEVSVFPSGGGAPAVAGVVVRPAIGTFGIDIVMAQPVMLGLEEATTAAVDWWSSVLDGTEWEGRSGQVHPGGCALGPADGGTQAPSTSPDRPGESVGVLVDELIILARSDSGARGAGYALSCRRGRGSTGESAYYPFAGVVGIRPGSGWVRRAVDLLRHEVGHVLGLVLWQPDSGLVTADEKYFTGPRAVEAFRAGGGDSALPGVPYHSYDHPWPRFGHWTGEHVGCELMSVRTWCGDQMMMDAVSLAALADAGYTVDMSRATPWRTPDAAQTATAELANDRVLVKPASTRAPRAPRR